MNMRKVWTLGERIQQRAGRIVAMLLVALLGAVASANAVAEGLRFSLVRTAQSESGDFLLRRGGWQSQPQTQHIAILIEHRGTRLLFGTGLGRQIDTQLDAELPWRIKRYGEVQPARDQLERDGLDIDRIVLGCVRWEHASGLADFPGVPVLASPDSLDYLRTATPPAVLPSQFRHPIDWQPLQFEARPYLGHGQSLDLFGDGQLVLVALTEHGAVGLYLTLADGRRFFFRGDREQGSAPQGVAALRDADIQAALGFYPRWVQ